MKEKICLILSGGAARCLAHIGVYKYLFRKGFEIVAVSGSSGGTIIGAFIAANYLPCQMENLATKIKPYKVLKPAVPPKGSLLNWKPVKRFFKHFLPRRFEELSIPLYASVTDLKTGENYLITSSKFLPAEISPDCTTERQKLPEDLKNEVAPKNIMMIGPTGSGKTEKISGLVFYRNKANFVVGINLIDAISASAALPPFFEPVRIDYRLYPFRTLKEAEVIALTDNGTTSTDEALLADGAFSNDLPVEPFLSREDCLKVCVDVTPIYPTEKLSGMLDYTIRAFVIGIRKHKEEKYPLCDIVIKPNLEGLSFINYTNPKPYVERGFKAAQKAFEKFL